MSLRVCRIDATNPPVIAKRYRLENGGLKKFVAAAVSDGMLTTVTMNSVAEFMEVLVQLRVDQALCYGVPKHDAKLVTEERWIALGRPDTPLPRTKATFSWPSGPGVMMFDYDPSSAVDAVLSRTELLETLYAACPSLREIDIVWWPSSSSHIFNNDKDLTGLRGQRFYVPVQDAADIERAGRDLMDRLWALGFGRFDVSSSGALLERSLFDSSVWQPSRIDFAAGADCGAGLRQERGLPVRIGPNKDQFLDTRNAIPSLTTEEHQRAKHNKLASKDSVTDHANRIHADWVNNRIQSIRLGDPTYTSTEAEAVVTRAFEHRLLEGPWRITVEAQSGELVELSIAEILASPEKYDGKLTLDPLEPSYDGTRLVGKLFLRNGKPNLYSFAHGGCNYRLRVSIPEIQLIQGRTVDATNKLLDVLRDTSDLFDFGDDLVRVSEGGKTHLLDEHGLRYTVSGLTQFWRESVGPGGVIFESLQDPPIAICRQLSALRSLRLLKPLIAVITAPTLRPDGSLLNLLGYDATTSLYLDMIDSPLHVPDEPTTDDAKSALDRLWLPFSDFPFVSPEARAVHLAAVLTTAVRVSLDASPAFAYDAPAQGSGKTLLARCVGVLAQGTEPSVWPHTTHKDDEETRKRIFTALRSGARSLIWDNVVGAFDSPALASCLTSPIFSDRILGQSVAATVPNRMLLLITGNNVVLQGEMPRRVLTCRIDPQVERPFARKFALDPYSYCRDNRQGMIAAALTLIRAAILHGKGLERQGRLASFERWDDWIRLAVLYANTLRPEFGDVMDSIVSQQAVDPEREALSELLCAWRGVHGDNAITVSALLSKLNSYSDSKMARLREAVTSFFGREIKDITTKSLGKALGYRKDRIVDGLRLEHGPKQNDAQTWRVRKVSETQPAFTGI
jgi:hypothetical protein